MRMRSSILLTFCLLHGAVFAAVDNSGTEFMLAFLDNYITGGVTFPVEIYVTTSSNTDAQVNITAPLFDPSLLLQTTVSRGSIEMLQVPADIRGEGVTLDNLGVYISSSEEITVYSVNKETYSTDAFISYPTDAIGSDYVVITWEDVAEVMVAGVTDNTTVTFNISTAYTSNFYYGGAYYYGGDILTVTLDRYQTFHIYTATGDLSGTRVTSSNPVSVFSGNFKVQVLDTNSMTTSDHLVEQLVATQSWGREFITFPSPDRNIGDYVRVFAADDDTTYTLDGATYTLNANEYHTYNLPSEQYYWISSDKGIQVAVFSKTIGQSSTNDGVYGGDPAMSLCVPVALYGSDYTWSTVTTTVGNYTNYIIAVTLKSYISELVLDNANLTANWTDVIGNSDYVGTYVTVAPGAHSIFNSVPAHSFLGIAYGNAEYNSYAYASGLRLAPINLPCNVSATSAGDGEDNDCDGRIDEETDNGIDDDGDGQIDEDLATAPRVDGQYGDWTAWGACTSTCGSGSGTQERTRTCDNPAPANNGLDCVGSATETTACTGPSTPCPVNGNWGDWGAWGTCTVTCGSGDQQRNRSCDNPAAQYGGNACSGSDMDNITCTISSYCLPSFYGNPDQGCNNVTEFGCATGGIQCLDIAFRCDGQNDCDDASDESHFFTGCAFQTCSKSGSGRNVVNQLLLIGVAVVCSVAMETCRWTI